MHELSIVEALMDHVFQAAKTNNIKQIQKIEVDTGALRQIIPDVMQEAFRSVVIDTMAQKSELVLNEIKALVKCRGCQNIFEPQIHDFLCPKCHLADNEILQGNEIVLKSIEGE